MEDDPSRAAELVQAFLWTCEDCGLDNFERAVTVAPESVPEDDAIDGDGVYVAAPDRVRCRHCGSRFRVVEPA